jgi:metal-sulfur cluster biosynthetic enzyme
MSPTRDEIINALKQVFDPEIPVNVYDLGLIYEIKIDGDSVAIDMSLTSQSCPAAKELPDMVRTRLVTLPSVSEAEVTVVWEPAWKPAMISPEGKKILGLDDEAQSSANG